MGARRLHIRECTWWYKTSRQIDPTPHMVAEMSRMPRTRQHELLTATTWIGTSGLPAARRWFSCAPLSGDTFIEHLYEQQRSCPVTPGERSLRGAFVW